MVSAETYVGEVEVADGGVVVFKVRGILGEILSPLALASSANTDLTSSFRFNSISCLKLAIFAALRASELLVEIVEKVVGLSV